MKAWWTLDKWTKVVYINDVSCDKCRGYQYRSARITGEFIGINMNCITDTITTIESIFQMHRTAKKAKNIFCPFSKFLRKGTKMDMKVFIISQFFWYFMSLLVPFPTDFYIFLPFLVFLCPFCPVDILPFTGDGWQKGTKILPCMRCNLSH